MNGVVAGSMVLTWGISSAQAYDTQQVASERGNVPLYLPSDIEPGEDLPLVISLHGFTGTGNAHENYFNLRSQIDDRKFMLCVPNGFQNSQGDRYWNATNYCCDVEGQAPDDSGYLRGLIEQVIAEHSVDLDSIHVVGHSNGGFMSYRMACDHADLVASIASLAGATWDNASECVPSEPVHVLQIHGTADDVIAYGGSCIIPFFFCHPSAEESVSIWSQYNQCDGGFQNAGNLDLVNGISGSETSRTLIVDGCPDQGTAELWSINGGDHGPSFNGNFRRELVDWLLSHRRSSPDACPIDLDGDGAVDGADLSLLLTEWGSATKTYDLDGDGTVGAADLGLLFAAWGACSE
jgi:polyhydroxybutyrate depolymerase